MKKISLLMTFAFICLLVFGAFNAGAAYSTDNITSPVEILNSDFEMDLDGAGNIPGWNIYGNGTLTDMPIGFTKEAYDANITSDLYNVDIAFDGAKNSSKSLSIYDAGNAGEVYAASDPMPVVAGEVLALDFDAKKIFRSTLGGSASAAYVGLYFSTDETFDMVEAAPLTAYRVAIGDAFTENTWKSGSKSMTVPSNAKFVRVIAYGNKGSISNFYIDNVNLTRTGSKKIADPQIKNSSNVQIDKLPESGDINISLQITSSYYSALPVVLLAGIYDANGRMISCSATNNYENINGSSTLNHLLSLPLENNHQELKIAVFGIQNNGRIINYMPMITKSK